MTTFQPPYFVITDATLMGLDFNRQIKEPGEDERFPDGAVGIFVDDNFWSAAALPLDEYRDVPVRDIVAEFWPHYLDQAIITPDHGSLERQVYNAEALAEAETERADYAEKTIASLRQEIARLRAGRTDMAPRSPTRLEYESNYFIRQYEHLLTAMAHTGTPKPDLPGVCAQCGLLMTDRVHDQKWIDKPLTSTDMVWAGSLGDDRSLGNDRRD